ncbi:Helix-turn-helix domain-containing protein [Arthrobacter alpinus]|uniref:Helix-turn-helix domain-containing protein n=1 Tax=Arthrobacter alpinus TaxID=656366 RepID=A0A1H5HAN0_9MICC|nr:helix-turn-helix domain-containing protein [Arthrobacter alpinus]SEE25019.1 Helix-turn-helix domain-containing protein [Arthrobacter alpinus]
MSLQLVDDFRPMSGRMKPRLNPAEAAEISRRHPVTVRRALIAEQLHGSQSGPGGRWLIREECLDAWIDGVKCEHHVNVTPIRRRVGKQLKAVTRK